MNWYLNSPLDVGKPSHLGETVIIILLLLLSFKWGLLLLFCYYFIIIFVLIIIVIIIIYTFLGGLLFLLNSHRCVGLPTSRGDHKKTNTKNTEKKNKVCGNERCHHWGQSRHIDCRVLGREVSTSLSVWCAGFFFQGNAGGWAPLLFFLRVVFKGERWEFVPRLKKKKGLEDMI